MQNLYVKSNKILLRKFKEDLNKRREGTFTDWKTQLADSSLQTDL